MIDSILFPPQEERQIWQDQLTTLLAEAEQRIATGPVTPTQDAAGFRDELTSFNFSQPLPLDDLLAWTVARLETGLVHINHPRYLGLFNPAPTFPAQLAERIVASFNPQLASATTSPAAVAIEAHVISAMAARAGLPPHATGHFTSGGSEANYTAAICALTRAHPGFAEHGSRAFPGKPVFYISRDSHLAWLKIAHQAGIGRDAARLVPTDGEGRMDLAALEGLIHTHRVAGHVPVMIVATAGTTAAGMIDPLPEAAAIARRHGIWYHVDAAWGGGVLASDRLRPLLAGIEEADSVTIDAHKWYATTMGCGMFLTAHPEVLSDSFTVNASFMPSHAPSLDPYVNSAQWSRRFMGLRLFLSLAAGGWAAHAALVERSVHLARLFARSATARGWVVVNDPSLAVVCLAPPPGSPPVREIVAELVETGRAWVSAAHFEGHDIVRACITHGETSLSDVTQIAELLDYYSRPKSKAA